MALYAGGRGNVGRALPCHEQTDRLQMTKEYSLRECNFSLRGNGDFCDISVMYWLPRRWGVVRLSGKRRLFTDEPLASDLAIGITDFLENAWQGTSDRVGRPVARGRSSRDSSTTNRRPLLPVVHLAS